MNHIHARKPWKKVGLGIKSGRIWQDGNVHVLMRNGVPVDEWWPRSATRDPGVLVNWGGMAGLCESRRAAVKALYEASQPKFPADQKIAETNYCGTAETV